MVTCHPKVVASIGKYLKHGISFYTVFGVNILVHGRDSGSAVKIGTTCYAAAAANPECAVNIL